MSGYEFWLEIVKEIIKYVSITGVGALLVSWIMRFSKSRQERLSETFKDLLGMTELTVDQYLEKLNVITELDKETTLLRGKVRELDALGMETYKLRMSDERKIKELTEKIMQDEIETTRHREETGRRINELENQAREYLAEVQTLRNEVDVLRKQNKAAKNVIQKLISALEKNNIEMPSFNGDLELLGDSVRGLVWPKGKPE